MVRDQLDVMITQPRRFRSGIKPICKDGVSAVIVDNSDQFTVEFAQHGCTQWVQFFGVLVRIRALAHGWTQGPRASQRGSRLPSIGRHSPCWTFSAKDAQPPAMARRAVTFSRLAHWGRLAFHWPISSPPRRLAALS